MRTIIYVLIIFSFLNLPSFSQTGWYQQTLPVSGTINDMQFINSETGWITLYNPFNFIKTTDGGKNWINLYSNSPQFSKIKFFNDSLGYTLGRDASFNGMISKTTNGGLNWIILNISPFGYSSFDFINPDTGWVGVKNDNIVSIIRTINGCINFQTQLFYNSSGLIDNIQFVKNNYLGNYFGWILINGSMSKTTNSGVNWTAPTSMVNGETGDFEWLFFLNKDTGWVTFRRGTDYRIYQTKNSGVNWLMQFRDSTGIFNPTTIEATSYSKVWAGNGFWNKVHASSNGGNIWGMQVSSIFRPIYIEIIDSLNGLIGYNQLARTTDGGGVITYVGFDSNQTSVPVAFILKQNYPNPFNPQTTIEFSIKQNSFVSLILYDILGKVIIKIYDNENLNSGNYKAVLDFSKKELSSGTYFYTLKISNKQSKRIFLETKKMTFIK